MKSLKQKHIILSRTDNIGDVILTLPLAALLKKAFPQCKLTFLARNYVRAIIENCPDLDGFLEWESLNNTSETQALSKLKSLNADAVVHVLPNKKIARLCKKAKIGLRIGTSHRLYHYLTCTHRVSFSRAKSTQHEAQLNVKLLRAFNLPSTYTLTDLSKLIRLKLNSPLPTKLKQFIDATKFNLIVHPLTNGHAREWPLEYFVQLINKLPTDKVNIIITGSNADHRLLQETLIAKCPRVLDATGQCTLAELMQLIQSVDGLLANSTGPLHLGAALGINSLGIFPPAPTMNPQRWAPLGKKAQFKVINQTCDATHCSDSSDCVCIRAITPDCVQQVITQWLESRL